jgi:hypothetical protein
LARDLGSVFFTKNDGERLIYGVTDYIDDDTVSKNRAAGRNFG